jgi:regulator of RNase E activity RraB
MAMTDPSGTFPDDEDGAVLAALKDAGVDLAKPIEVEFVVDAPDEAAAAEVAAAVREAGYDCQVELDEGEGDEGDDEAGPCWAVYVSVEMVAEHARIGALQRTFSQLAEPFGGACDGWGAIA